MNAQSDAGSELKDRRLESLYRETDGPEPPAELDRAILAAARREVHARPMLGSARLRQWRLPVSIAAVVVLSVTVVTLVTEQGGGEPAETLVLSRLAEPAPAASPAPVAEPAATEPRQGAQSRSALRERAAGSPTVESGAGAVAEPRPQARGDTAGRQAPQAPVPGTADTRLSRREEVTAVGKSQDDTLARATAESPKAEPHGDVATAPGVAAKAAAPQPGPAPAPVAGALRSLPTESAVGEQSSAAQVQPARKPIPLALDPAQMIKALEGQPPERWLEKIEALRRGGRNTEADELLAAFRKRYPGHPGGAAR